VLARTARTFRVSFRVPKLVSKKVYADPFFDQQLGYTRSLLGTEHDRFCFNG
jgi:hypothetical protein